MGMSAREDRFQRDIEGRLIASINVDLDMFLLAVEQAGFIPGGVSEPDPLHDPGPVRFRQHRVAILGPDPGIRAIEAVVVAAGPIVRAEANRLHSRVTQPGQQPKVVQLSRSCRRDDSRSRRPEPPAAERAVWVCARKSAREGQTVLPWIVVKSKYG